jgi:bifunctional oligoribonuclease and PAP phosphatase NrnA
VSATTQTSNHKLVKIAAQLRKGERFLLCSHIGPDGDAIGSMLGMRLLLADLGKPDVVCVCADPVPRIYQWLPGADAVEVPDQVSGEFDTVVILDVAQRERIGEAARFIHDGATVIIIDHHLDVEPFGQLAFTDHTYAATGQILCDLFEAAERPLSRAAAACLYVALSTDTGGFRYANTTPAAHEAAAKLIATGIDVAEISSRVFDVISVPKFKMMVNVLDRTRLSLTGRLAVSEIRLEDMRASGAQDEDADGLINVPRNIEGVEVAVIFKENEAHTTKVSMRARSGFNCAHFLQQFGGGGHAGAAGATLEEPIVAARQRVTAALLQALGAK